MSDAGAITGPKEIDSSTLLDDVDHHFLVTAGPGAGKTHWLSEHLANVVRRSSRLHPLARVACISYTNVAVEEMTRRLGLSAKSVESRTIHSFLYAHVLKPYLRLLEQTPEGCPLDHRGLRTPEKPAPTYSLVTGWLESINKKIGIFLGGQEEWYSYLALVQWVLDAKREKWSLLPPRKDPKGIPVRQLETYKEYCWSKGLIHHDDVLYFSHRLLLRFPALRRFVVARFPYIFVDEFQDTSAAQAQLLKWLALEGATVGVIGDPEQSIFEWNGASREAFLTFELPGQHRYSMRANRRSTRSIIATLGLLRSDGIEQIAQRDEIGELTTVLCGPLERCVAHVEKTYPERASAAMLARRHSDVARLRGFDTPSSDVWTRFKKVDDDRARFVLRVVTGVELSRAGRLVAASQELIRTYEVVRGKPQKPLKTDAPPADWQARAAAVKVMIALHRDYDEYNSGTLFDFYKRLEAIYANALPGSSITAITSGKIKEFAQATPYRELAAYPLETADTRDVRVIHQAKGAEFDRVILFAGDEQLGHLLGIATDSEEARVTYVGASRAREELVILVEELSAAQADALQGRGFRVIDV